MPPTAGCKPSPIVQCVRRGVIASWNAQLSGWFVFTLSTDCRAVSTRLGTLLAQRGFDRQAFGRVCGADLAKRCQNRTIQLPVEARPPTRTRGAGDVVQAHGGGAPLGCRSSLSRVGDDGGLLAVGKLHLIAGHGCPAASSARDAHRSCASGWDSAAVLLPFCARNGDTRCARWADTDGTETALRSTFSAPESPRS
jgi:hypothetical protein